MTTDVARAITGEDVRVDPVAVDVVHEDRVPVLIRERVSEVDHRAAVGVPTADRVRDPVARVGARPEVVEVVRDRLDVVVDVRVEVLAALPVVTRALDDVVEVRNHARRDETLPVIVEVDAPLVARAPREDVELVPFRVVPPNRRVDLGAILVLRPGLPDL